VRERSIPDPFSLSVVDIISLAFAAVVTLNTLTSESRGRGSTPELNGDDFLQVNPLYTGRIPAEDLVSFEWDVPVNLMLVGKNSDGSAVVINTTRIPADIGFSGEHYFLLTAEFLENIEDLTFCLNPRNGREMGVLRDLGGGPPLKVASSALSINWTETFNIDTWHVEIPNDLF